MSTKQKLSPLTDMWDFKDVLDTASNEEGIIEKRPRTSRKAEDWEEVINPEQEPWNLERFNYRVGESPPLRLQGDEVICSDSYAITVEFAKRIAKDAQRAWSSKKLVEGDVEGDPYTYTIHGEQSGRVRVGCQKYTRDVVEAFIKRVGWESKATAKAKKKARG